MFEVSEEDRKVFLEYLSRRPYIEVAPLISRIATWKKIDKKNGKDKENKKILSLVIPISKTRQIQMVKKLETEQLKKEEIVNKHTKIRVLKEGENK